MRLLMLLHSFIDVCNITLYIEKQVPPKMRTSGTTIHGSNELWQGLESRLRLCSKSLIILLRSSNIALMP